MTEEKTYCQVTDHRERRAELRRENGHIILSCMAGEYAEVFLEPHQCELFAEGHKRAAEEERVDLPANVEYKPCTVKHSP